MDRDDLTTDREAEAETIFLRGVKRIEKAHSVRRIDANAGVCDCYGNMPVYHARRDSQNPASTLHTSHSFDGIAHEVEHDLLKLNPVRFDVRQCSVEVDTESDAGTFKLPL